LELCDFSQNTIKLFIDNSLSTCAGVVNIRPTDSNDMLGEPKSADLKFGAAVLQELQILRFLGNTAAVGRYEGELKFITDRGNVTRAEIETFYRQNVGKSITAEVDAQFNRVDFVLAGTTTGYNSVLARDAKTGQYELSYEDVNDVVKKLSAPLLQALLVTMRNSGDFNQRV
jgi:hypothetical protein